MLTFNVSSNISDIDDEIFMSLMNLNVATEPRNIDKNKKNGITNLNFYSVNWLKNHYN